MRRGALSFCAVTAYRLWDKLRLMFSSPPPLPNSNWGYSFLPRTVNRIKTPETENEASTRTYIIIEETVEILRYFMQSLQ
jgi:hypothetical protein